MRDEILIEALEEAHDREMARLGLGASPYEDEDLNTSTNWDEWYIDNAIDREREDRMLYER